MANTIIFGSSSAGKTTFAVQEDMLPHFRDGGIIVTDVKLIRERWEQEFGKEQCDKRLFIFEEPDLGDMDARSDFQKWETFEKFIEMNDAKGRAPMFVIDEAQGKFPTGMKTTVDEEGAFTDTFPNKLLYLLTRQRHYLANFVFITTNPFNVWAKLRAECHNCVYVENAELKGAKKAFTTKKWDRKIPRNYADEKCKGEGHDLAPKPYNPVTWEFFQSQSKAKEQGGRDLEGRYTRKKVIWKRFPVLAGMVAIPVMIYSGYNLLNRDRTSPTLQAAQKAPESTKAENGTVVPSNPENLPSEPEFGPDDAIGDLEAYDADNAWKDRRFQIEDARIWKYGEKDGEYVDFPVMVYDAAWRPLETNVPAQWVAARMGFTATYEECSVTFSRTDQPVHVLQRPGCDAYAALRSAEQARSQAARPVRPAPGGSEAVDRSDGPQSGRRDNGVFSDQESSRVRDYRAAGGSGN